MEGERRVQIIIAVIAGTLLAFAYGVGYYVGKGAGIEEEKKVCEIQKKQIIKTLSRIAPVSRPEPIEEKVVGIPPRKEEKKQQEKETKASTSTAVASKGNNEAQEETVPVKQEVKIEEKTQQEVVASNEAAKKEQQVKTEKPVIPVVESKVQETKLVKKAATSKSAVSKQERKPGKRYYLQVGIFRNKANAVKLAQELNSKGFQSKTVFGKRYVKVIVGYYDSLHQARVVQRELRSAGFDSVLKWRKN